MKAVVQRIMSLLVAAAIAWAPTQARPRVRCLTLGTDAPVRCCCSDSDSKAATDPTLSCCTREPAAERLAAQAVSESASVTPVVTVTLVPTPVARAVPSCIRTVDIEPVGPPLPLRV